MFSEKSRLVKIIILGGIVFGLCWYASWAGPRANPAPADVLTGNFGYPAPIDAPYTEIIEINPEESSLGLKTEGHEFTARFNELPTTEVGENISLTGTVVDGDLVEVAAWHIHPIRMLKYYFSLPAIILVIYLLFKKYRFDWRRVEFFEKSRDLAKQGSR